MTLIDLKFQKINFCYQRRHENDYLSTATSLRQLRWGFQLIRLTEEPVREINIEVAEHATDMRAP